MSRDYKLYLEDIREAIWKIEHYTQEATYEEFISNNLIRDAVLHNLQVIGEAASHIPSAIKEARPSIEWKGIVGLRNIIAHKYFGITFDIIWNIIKSDLPNLRRTVEDMIAHEQE